MIGDIILKIKTFFKQHILCIHEYKHIHRHDTGGSFENCVKCDKIK